MQSNNLISEIQPVLNSGICVGCGICAVLAPEAIQMLRDNDGVMTAKIKDALAAEKITAGICPFNSASANEDAHAARIWPELPIDEAFGRFRSLWAGHVSEGEYRIAGSSGGITTWLLAEVLSSGLVDAVIHVHPEMGEEKTSLFSYSVSRNISEVQAGSKTRYYSVSMEKALVEVLRTGERIALVGVPCFIKAARNLAVRIPNFSEQLVMTLSLVCGHMKSAGFVESLAWQAGVKPHELVSADFRVKVAGFSANNYGFAAWRNGARPIIRPMAKMAGRRWDGGYHRLKACDYCDDVFGETADVSLGDAWLPEYVNDYKGTNILVVRSSVIDAVIRQGLTGERLSLKELTPDRIAAAQSGGLRDRRQGLAYRLYLDDLSGKWRPQRRVEPYSQGLTLMRRINYRLRRLVRQRSFASIRFARKIGVIHLYVWEMTFWHACFKVLSLIEKRLIHVNVGERSSQN